jgi:hypothetical protein
VCNSTLPSVHTRAVSASTPQSTCPFSSSWALSRSSRMLLPDVSQSWSRVMAQSLIPIHSQHGRWQGWL